MLIHIFKLILFIVIYSLFALRSPLSHLYFIGRLTANLSSDNPIVPKKSDNSNILTLNYLQLFAEAIANGHQSPILIFTKV
ncbi:MAG: hypothetical protein HWQ43_28950 [Nostoc sp. JL31]|uniref:hypothetical protein n=1 Tax=Nostoc sp. JL31 TaxID=2815395 RepID=UPI0025CEF411|nr:hypothetical protein [Nostoc sp. JL31]MBN3892982.1 hypothetical protein [Nostoc sp. JL31]